MAAATQADVLLVTVTSVETNAVLEAFTEPDRGPTTKHIDGRVYFDLGVVNGGRVMLTRSEMGTGGLGAAHQAIAKGIAAVSPAAVVMVGIAFGVSEETQSVGDVLVTEQLRLYDLQRVGTQNDGAPKIVLRGDKPRASSALINLLKSAEATWRGPKLRFGTVLTGEKLVDNIDFRNQLRSLEPEAIGGEMEGAGLYVACHDEKVDWILVKAICDWADGQKSKNKSRRQALAARNAASFVLHALRFVKIGWTSPHRGPSDRIRFSADERPQRPSSPPPSLLPATHRSAVYPEVRGPIALDSAFYVERNADLQMEASVNALRSFPYILEQRHVGKSSLLVRVLTRAKQRGVRTVHIDLDEIGMDELKDYAVFTRHFAEILAMELGLPGATVDGVFARQLPTGKKLTAVLDEALDARDERLLVALDHIDVLRRFGWGADFLRLVRAWYGKGSRSSSWYNRFNIILVGASDPETLLPSAAKSDSPFNVGKRVRLADFTTAEIAALAEAYRIAASPTTLEAVKDLVGGHPEQTHRLIVHCANHGIDLFDAIANGSAVHLFEDDLRRARKVLDESPELRRFLETLGDGNARSDGHPATMLYWLGLLRREGPRRNWRSRLYREHLLQERP